MTILNLKKVSSTVTALFCLVSSYTYSLKPLTRRFAATSPTRGEVIKCWLPLPLPLWERSPRAKRVAGEGAFRWTKLNSYCTRLLRLLQSRGMTISPIPSLRTLRKQGEVIQKSNR